MSAALGNGTKLSTLQLPSTWEAPLLGGESKARTRMTFNTCGSGAPRAASPHHAIPQVGDAGCLEDAFQFELRSARVEAVEQPLP